MKEPLTRKLKYIMFLLLVVWLSSCITAITPPATPSTLPPPTTISHTIVVTASNATPIAVTPSVSPTVTTELPTATIASPTMRPTLTPSITPAPTLTIVEESDLVSGLLQNNGGCQLPCWWGFLPGETQSHTVRTFFLSRGKEILDYGDPYEFTIVFDTLNHNQYQIYRENENIIDLIEISATPLADAEGYPKYGDTQFSKEWAAYTLSGILTTQGQPAEILLGLAPSTPWSPFDLLLFYPDKGILARYSGPSVPSGENFQICPHQSEITLWLWSPKQGMTLEEIPGIKGYTANKMSDFQSIEEATTTEVVEFYRMFAEEGVRDCFETPSEKW